MPWLPAISSPGTPTSRRASSGMRPVTIATTARRSASAASAPSAPSTSPAMKGSWTIGDSVPSKSVRRPAGSAASASAASARARDSDPSVWRLDSGTVKRLSSWALPIILGVAGVALIIIGSLDLETEPTPSLPDLLTPTPVAQASETPAPTASPDAPTSPTAEPTATPDPDAAARRRRRRAAPGRVGRHQRGRQAVDQHRHRRLPAERRRLHPQPGPPAGAQHELVHLRARREPPLQAALERAGRRGAADPDVGRLDPPLRRHRGAPERRLPGRRRDREQPRGLRHHPAARAPDPRQLRGRSLDGRRPTTSGSRSRPRRATTATGASW